MILSLSINIENLETPKKVFREVVNTLFQSVLYF